MFVVVYLGRRSQTRFAPGFIIAAFQALAHCTNAQSFEMLASLSRVREKIFIFNFGAPRF
jgi:hypothetical protein